MSDRIELQRQRAELIAQARTLTEKADMTAAEQRSFNSLLASAEYISAKLGDGLKIEGRTVEAIQADLDRVGEPVIKPGDRTSRELRAGEVRLLKPEERMSALPGHENTEGLSFGRMIKGLATGDWKNADAERRAAQNEGTNSAGGYMVPTPIATQVIDLARSATVCLQAGARTVPMESSTLSLPRLTADAPAAWKAELAAASTGVQTFDRVLFTAKTLYTLIPISIELFEDVSDLAGEIDGAVAKAIALGLDQAALLGSGTGATPAGILNAAGVNAQHAVTNGATPTYDMFSQAVDTIHGLNFEPNAVVFAPRTSGELDRLKDSQSRYLVPPASFQRLKPFVTSSIGITDTYGTANTASKAFVGDFRQMLFGMRHELTIEVLPAGYDGTYSGAEHGVVFIRAYIRADVQFAHPQAFVYMDGLL